MKKDCENIYQFYPAIESKAQARCPFCQVKSDYRTFRNGRYNLSRKNKTIYVKMCRDCFNRAKYHEEYAKEILDKVTTFLGL